MVPQNEKKALGKTAKRRKGGRKRRARGYASGHETAPAAYRPLVPGGGAIRGVSRLWLIFPSLLGWEKGGLRRGGTPVLRGRYLPFSRGFSPLEPTKGGLLLRGFPCATMGSESSFSGGPLRRGSPYREEGARKPRGAFLGGS